MRDTINLPLLPKADGYPSYLLWALHMGAGKKVEHLHSEAAIEAVLGNETGWLWLHLDLVDQRSHDWVERLCRLPLTVRALLEDRNHGVSLGHEDGFLHGILPDFFHEEGQQATSVGRLYFALSEHVLITGGRQRLTAAEDVRRQIAKPLQADTASDLFGRIVLTFCRNALSRVAEATTALDEVEDKLVADHMTDERRQLKSVRRLAVSLHRPLAGLILLLQDDMSAWPLSAPSQAMLETLTGHLERLDREITTVNDRARLIQEEISAELADQSNRSLRALTIMSALLLPGTLVAGIFGMNNDDLPLAHTPGGFVIVLLLGAAATLLFYWLMRRAGADFRI